jgi:TolB-like protein
MILADAVHAQARTDDAVDTERKSGEAAANDEAASSVPARAAIEVALARILASHAFRQSERHRVFLRYVVEATLEGRARCLKEVVIGLDVFGRDLDGYDPRRDSIVRVEARRLRKKLQRYYEVEGDRDAVELRLNAGSYVPQFGLRLPSHRTRATPPLFLALPLLGATSGPSTMAIGLADQLIDRLGAVEGIKVVAPMAAAMLREKPLDMDALRRHHGVDYVIDGSIAQVDARIRCTVHLSRTSDRLRLWSGLFDFDPAATGTAIDSDLFAFQDRITDALFDAVNAERKDA